MGKRKGEAVREPAKIVSIDEGKIRKELGELVRRVMGSGLYFIVSRR